MKIYILNIDFLSFVIKKWNLKYQISLLTPSVSCNTAIFSCNSTGPCDALKNAFRHSLWCFQPAVAEIRVAWGLFIFANSTCSLNAPGMTSWLSASYLASCAAMLNVSSAVGYAEPLFPPLFRSRCWASAHVFWGDIGIYWVRPQRVFDHPPITWDSVVENNLLSWLPFLLCAFMS